VLESEGEPRLVKTDFDFGWKDRRSPPAQLELTLQHQRGDILDIGCGTCQLYKWLREYGWKGCYYGIDVKRYETYRYPADVNLIVGDAMELEFPRTDTVVLYDVLEHVDNPTYLLHKALESTRSNVLLSVPKRNEQLWQLGVVEYHQLDKTHKHCGFSAEETRKLVYYSGGRMVTSKQLVETSAALCAGLWNSVLPKAVVYLLGRAFRSKTYFQEIWCEVVRILPSSDMPGRALIAHSGSPTVVPRQDL
jgi:SAM-dependent methyltransferase